MVGLASVGPSERVLEIGTGRGALTRRLVGVSSRFEGYEVDRESYERLAKELAGSQAVLHNADAFEFSPEFDVLLSSLPYSESSEFVEWLAKRKYGRAVVLLQRDFALKLTAPPSAPSYRAVSVIARASADVRVVSGVRREAFDPPPRVDSCVVEMRWKRTLSGGQVATIKRIFSQRRKTVRAALRSLGLGEPPSAPAAGENLQLQCRVSSLRPESVLAMAGVLGRAKGGEGRA